MSIIMNIFGIIIVLLISYLIFRSGLKLRYLAPGCFISVFILSSIFISLDYSNRGKTIEFFNNGQILLNSHAIDLLSFASAFSTLATFFLVLGVVAIRKNVFF